MPVPNIPASSSPISHIQSNQNRETEKSGYRRRRRRRRVGALSRRTWQPPASWSVSLRAAMASWRHSKARRSELTNTRLEWHGVRRRSSGIRPISRALEKKGRSEVETMTSAGSSVDGGRCRRRHSRAAGRASQGRSRGGVKEKRLPCEGREPFC